MVIGRNDPRLAKNTGLKEAIQIGLDEAFAALEEAIYDLSDEQVASFPIPGRNNIAWIVMHTLMNLDIYAVCFQTGKGTVDLWDQRWHYNSPRPRPGEPFPSQQEMMQMLRGLRAAAQPALEEADEGALLGRRRCEDWWSGTAADAYMRTIFHTMAHLRQVWLLRGALGLTDGKSWPQQHWA